MLVPQKLCHFLPHHLTLASIGWLLIPSLTLLNLVFAIDPIVRQFLTATVYTQVLL